ncbi:CAP domain-containing protein [Streptomyces sp. NPDC056600]|uniref:CAP domain-containing protein n=1 Tax=Streptomyces sp. NPDC056600 TaxID=3345874 RepID=UPI0036CB97A3
MGRHRRSAAGRKGSGGTPRATGAAPDAAGPQQGHEQQYRTTHDSYGSYPQGSNSPYGYGGPQGYDGGHDGYDGYDQHRGRVGSAGGDPYARSHAYLFGTEESAVPAGAQDAPTTALPAQRPAPSGPAGPAGPSGHRSKGRRTRHPVRTGLLGVSAALAIGVVAAATGMVPGLDTYRLGGDGAIRAFDGPDNTETQQGGAGGRVDPGASSGGAGTGSAKPTPTASPSASKEKKEKAEPSPEPTAEKTTEPEKPAPTTKTAEPRKPASGGSADLSQEDAARARVLQLVNQERASAGCSPVKADSGLTDLADDFSRAMAEQDFFDHTDPSGATPWDRAAAAGVDNLGGENIARGQADAAAVMDAWMNSEGHRANILNCDFKTLGVGVHFASGGPWWTQDFGY